MQDHKDKDIILEGLFTVHYDGVNASNDGGCGQVIQDHDVQILASMLCCMQLMLLIMNECIVY